MKLNLEELREQKALLEKHLAWIDAKIAELHGAESADTAETGKPPAAPQPVAQEEPQAAPIASQPATTTPELSDIEQIEAQITAAEAKKGCIIWFSVAVVAFFSLIALIYILRPSWDEEKAEEYRQRVEEKQK